MPLAHRMETTQTKGNSELTLSYEQSLTWHRLTDARHKEISRIIYGGMAGGGKSVLISIWLDFMCRQYDGTRYYMGRDTLKDIKESILLTFFEVVSVYTHSKIKYREDKSKITYPNGSEIYLLETFHYPADPNFDRFGSREYTAGAIEEGITTTERAANILLSRTRYKHDVFNLYPKQLITCNPGPGWIKDRIVKPQLEGGEKSPNHIFIPATLRSNPNKEFAVRYEKTLQENLSTFDRERLLSGNWDAQEKTGAEFLKDFDPEKSRRPVAYNFRFPLHITFDENVHPYITCEIWQLEGKQARQIAEICLAPPLNSRTKVCDRIIKMFPDHIAGMFIYGDSTSKKADTAKEYGENFFTDIMTYLKKYHPVSRVTKANPPVVSSGQFINQVFERKYRGIEILIDPSCEKSLFDYAYALEDADGTILKKKITDPTTKIQYEKHGHHVDAMRYFICSAFSEDFNYYLHGEFNPAYETGTDRSYRFQR